MRACIPNPVCLALSNLPTHQDQDWYEVSLKERYSLAARRADRWLGLPLCYAPLGAPVICGVGLRMQGSEGVWGVRAGLVLCSRARGHATLDCGAQETKSAHGCCSEAVLRSLGQFFGAADPP